MLSGLPASGKSTEARELVSKTGNSGRINRDDLRAMMFNSEWTGMREHIIVAAEKALARVLVQHGFNPIIDDTNLSDKHWQIWKTVAKDLGIDFHGTKAKTSLEECILRDNERTTGRVGPAIIYRLALQNGMIPWDDEPIAIVDLDGTLADGTHREHLVRNADDLPNFKKDWVKYYSLLRYDKPYDVVVQWVQELAKDHTICIVSGRPDTYQLGTIWWLENYQIPFDYIFMRRGNDKREDSIVKKEILDLLPKEKIDFAIDDRPRVIRMWRENGVKVFPVRGAVEEF